MLHLNNEHAVESVRQCVTWENNTNTPTHRPTVTPCHFQHGQVCAVRDVCVLNCQPVSRWINRSVCVSTVDISWCSTVYSIWLGLYNVQMEWRDWIKTKRKNTDAPNRKCVKDVKHPNLYCNRFRMHSLQCYFPIFSQNQVKSVVPLLWKDPPET